MPKYETEEDLAREAVVAGIVKKSWGVELQKFGPPWILDYAVFFDGKLSGFIEVRYRFNASTKYPTFSMANDKTIAARHFGDLGVPVALIIKFTDGLFIIDPREPDFIAMGGRSDRNDPKDHREMAHYYTWRLKHFTKDAMLTYVMPFSSLRPKGHEIEPTSSPSSVRLGGQYGQTGGQYRP